MFKAKVTETGVGLFYTEFPRDLAAGFKVSHPRNIYNSKKEKAFYHPRVRHLWVRKAKQSIAEIPLPAAVRIVLCCRCHQIPHWRWWPQTVPQGRASAPAGQTMQGNSRKAWKCTAASSNIPLCLWKFPCCSAKLTAWYSP